MQSFVAATTRLLFLESIKEVFHAQGAWYSLNTVSAMVHGQAFSNTTGQTTSYPRPSRELLYPLHRDALSRLVGLSLGKINLY